jgi:hypothetical protein
MRRLGHRAGRDKRDAAREAEDRLDKASRPLFPSSSSLPQAHTIVPSQRRGADVLVLPFSPSASPLCLYFLYLLLFRVRLSRGVHLAPFCGFDCSTCSRISSDLSYRAYCCYRCCSFLCTYCICISTSDISRAFTKAVSANQLRLKHSGHVLTSLAFLCLCLLVS